MQKANLAQDEAITIVLPPDKPIELSVTTGPATQAAATFVPEYQPWKDAAWIVLPVRVPATAVANSSVAASLIGSNQVGFVNVPSGEKVRIRRSDANGGNGLVGCDIVTSAGRVFSDGVQSFLPQLTKFAASGSMVVPPGRYSVTVVGLGAGAGGAGGGGGYSGGTGSGGGGSGGNCGNLAVSTMPVTPGDVITVTIGVGGVGGAIGAAGAPGTAGSNGADGGATIITNGTWTLKIPGGSGNAVPFNGVAVTFAAAATRGGLAGAVAAAGGAGNSPIAVGSVAVSVFGGLLGLNTDVIPSAGANSGASSAGTTNAGGAGGGYGGSGTGTRGSLSVVSTQGVVPAATVGGTAAAHSLVVAATDPLGLWPQSAPPSGGAGGAGAAGAAGPGQAGGAGGIGAGGGGGGGGGSSSGGVGGAGGIGGAGGNGYAVIYY